MNSSAKQIQSSVSPNLRVRLSPSLTLKAFLRRLRWNKVKKCCTTAIYTHTGGLIRFYLVIWSVLSQFKWPLLFLQHRGRGRRTRLSIRSQDPNNSSDTERGPCLATSLSTSPSSPSPLPPTSSYSSLLLWAPFVCWDTGYQDLERSAWSLVDARVITQTITYHTDKQLQK